MSTPEHADAIETLRFAVLLAVTKRAHLTGLRAGPETEMIVSDIVETVTDRSIGWALRAIGEESAGAISANRT
jgi:hypothetical protein